MPASHPGFSIHLDCPEGWADRTMTVFAAPGGGGFEANVVAARDAMREDEGFEAYADRQRQTFADGLPGFRLISDQPGMVRAREAVALEFEWNAGTGPLRQRAIFIDVGHGRVATFAATAASGEFEERRAAFDAVFASLRIEEGPA